MSVQANVQARVEQARTMVKERLTTARGRVDEMKAKYGAGGGLGFGVMDRLMAGTSSQYRIGGGQVIDQIRAKAKTRPILGSFMMQGGGGGMRGDLANDPSLADDIYEQNSRRNTRYFSQDLSVTV